VPRVAAARAALAVAAALAASAVAVTGAIAFVGLLAQLAARLVAGGSHRRLLPIAMLMRSTSCAPHAKETDAACSVMS
jgi:ABC-type Fe3+-siderophore transport system permease subunit